MKAGVIDLLAEILRGTPKLDGALCIGRHTLFTDHDGLDPDAREHAIERAVALCTECEVSWKCAEFAAKSPRGRLSGVVAGRVIGQDTGDRRSA